MRPAYEIREPELASTGPTAEALWLRNLLGYTADSAAAKFAQGYVDNPAGPGRIFLLTVAGTDNACGTMALHRRRFWDGPQEVRAAGLGDFVVDAEHRSLLPALRLARHAVTTGTADCDLVYATPNDKAAPVIMRAGLASVGVMGRYAKPLASAGFIARRLPGPVGRALVPLADAAMRVADALRSLAHPGGRLRGARAALDDGRIDDIWRRRPAGWLLSERTSRMLSWRLAGRALGDAQVWIAHDAAGQPCGYVAWRHRGGFCEVLDFLCVSTERLAGPLLLAFARWVRPQRVQSVSVEFFGLPSVVAQIEAAGFVRRPEHLGVYAAAHQGERAPDAARWFMTRFDDDTD